MARGSGSGAAAPAHTSSTPEGARPESVGSVEAARSETARSEAAPPSFDIVRVNAEGEMVIAGRSVPNEPVDVLLDGQVVETVLADASGKFVVVIAVGAAIEPRELRLRAKLPAMSRDGTALPTGSKGADATATVPSGTASGPDEATTPSATVVAGPPAERPRVADEVRPGATTPADAGPRLSTAAGTLLNPSGGSAAPSPEGEGSTESANEVAALEETMPRSADTDGAADPRAPPPAEGDTLLSEPVIVLPPERAGDVPVVVQPNGEELAMLQPGGPEAEGVVLDQLTQDPDGDLLLRGRARPGHAVRIYGNGQEIGTVAVAEGSWSLTIAGARAENIRLFRLDEIGGTGEVASRVEVPFEPSGAASQLVRDRKITVRRGDNLWRIAEQHYGDGIRYSLIFGANGGLIRDPNLIYPDQVFTIPELVEAE